MDSRGSEPSEGGSEAESSVGRRVLPLLAVVTPVLFFFLLPPLSKSGLWEPYELGVADLARRIAINVLGAGQLALNGADNSVPYLNDLGRPQLPFTSIAIGFRLFGLHEWAGRLPLALWGVGGVVALYGSVARLVDRRAGLYAAVALVTMPVYLVQARTMMGEITTMAAVAMAFGGLAVAAFDTRGGSAGRALWAGVGILGLAAGFASRGAILGVMVPCLAIGLAKAVEVLAGERRGDAAGHVVAGMSLVIGCMAAAMGAAALGAKSTDVNAWIGGAVKAQTHYPTFDFYLAHVGHALVPWSAFAPFALGRLFIPPVGQRGDDAARESSVRVAVLLGVAVAFAAHGWLAPKIDLVAFTGPALVAAACGIAIRDFERGAHASIALAVGTLVLAGVFHHDFHELPDKAYQAFGVAGAAFPESFKDKALALWWVALGGFAVVTFVTWVERDPKRRPFDPKSYLVIANGLRDAWDGTVVLMWLALVAGLSVASLVVWMGLRFHWKMVNQLGAQLREVLLHAWWGALIGPPAIIFGVYFLCDAWLWTFGRARALGPASFTRGFEPFEDLLRDVKQGDSSTRVAGGVAVAPLMLLALPALVYLAAHKAGVRTGISVAVAVPSGIAAFLALGMLGDLLRGRRAAGMVVGAGVVGLVMSLFYYPALANQLSPKDVFETYQRQRTGNEPLGLFGVGGRTAAYYAGGQPPSFNDTQSAQRWLVAGPERRFLAVKAEELPRLNMAFRERTQPHQNLPVVDARSSQILLVASSLAPGEKNQSPFDTSVLTYETAPRPQRVILANMEDKLQVLGLDILDKNDRLVDSMTPGRPYKMRTYFKVLAPVGQEWEFFIHIDGYRKRHNGDHKVMKGKYPMSLWLKDDVLVDEYEVSLEPNFTPGQYTIFFGLFVGESRLKVTSGPSDGDNRINGGALKVQ